MFESQLPSMSKQKGLDAMNLAMIRGISLPILIGFTSIIVACSDPAADPAHVPPGGKLGPNARANFPSYAKHEAKEVDALRGASVNDRNAFCKSYCASEFAWPPEQFTKSSMENFFQTPEKTDLRCDYSETSTDIGGSELHTGGWIREQCQKRGLEGCYWSINYGKRLEGRAACIRAVFPDGDSAGDAVVD